MKKETGKITVINQYGRMVIGEEAWFWDDDPKKAQKNVLEGVWPEEPPGCDYRTDNTAYENASPTHPLICKLEGNVAYGPISEPSRQRLTNMFEIKNEIKVTAPKNTKDFFLIRKTGAKDLEWISRDSADEVSNEYFLWRDLGLPMRIEAAGETPNQSKPEEKKDESIVAIEAELNVIWNALRDTIDVISQALKNKKKGGES